MAKRKPKVYIPTYKIIIMCGLVIVACMTLLLITNINSIRESKHKEETSLTQRFESEDNKKNEATKTEKKKDASEAKKETKPSEPAKKTLAEEVRPSEKKIEPAKTETKPAETPKKETVVAVTKTETAKTTTQSPQTDEKAKAPATVQPSKTNENKTTAATSASVTQAVTSAAAVTTTKEVPKVEKKTETKKDFGFPQAVNNAQLIFVFDDGGQNLTHLEKFLSLPFPITIAVLPKLVHSKESADRIRKTQHELMLHQPMQALNTKVNPGPGAITPEMSENEIISVLFQNINEIGPIAGVNNHEGSAITADAEKMSVIMKTVSENGIFFLDSRTNVDTTVPFVADAMGYSYYERNVFLDNTKNRADILKEINKGLALANKNGAVIMIGHIWSADVLPGLLNEIYPELKQKGYTFSTVSKSKAKK